MTRMQAMPRPADTATLPMAAALVARRLRQPRLAFVRIGLVVTVLDAVAFTLATWFALFAATPPGVFTPMPAAAHAALAGILGAAIATAAGASGRRLLRRRVRGALVTFSAYTIPLAGLALPRGGDAAGDLLAAGFLAGLCVILPVRLAVAAFVNWAVASGVTDRRAVVAGGGLEAERLIRGLAARPDNDIRIHAVFDDRNRPRTGSPVLDVPVIGSFADLVRFCRDAEIDLILLTLPPSAEARIATLLAQFRVLPVPVHLTAFSTGFRFDDGTGLTQLLPATFRPERRLAKRVFDLVFATLLLVGLAPVMALAALAVRLDSPGPVFFRQDRHGFNDRVVRVWKFRTMFADQCDPDARKIVTRGDPRVTRVGRVLRRTSLDELPQLFNVLGGSLSLVGPRPHAVDARSSRRERFAAIVEGYSARHRLPPGITGWAQVNGYRGEVCDPESLRRRVEHDLDYIENWSLWRDFVILLRTPASLVTTGRAY